MDPTSDLAHLLAAHRGIGPELLTVARHLATTPRGRVLRRALARAGRGAQLGLHLVPGVVTVDLLEHGADRRVVLDRGCVVALVRGGDSDAALALPGEHAPAGLNVIVVWRPARLWDRARAWWREKTWKP